MPEEKETELLAKIAELDRDIEAWQNKYVVVLEELLEKKASYAHLHEAYGRLFNAYYDLRRKLIEIKDG